MTKQTAMHEAQQYVARLAASQEKLGYQRPSQKVMKQAAGEAAAAVRALAALSQR